MKITLKVLMVIVVIGLILMAVGLGLGASTQFYIDNSGIHTSAMFNETIKKENTDEFDQIEISVAAANVEIIPSSEYGFEILNHSKHKINYELKDGKLTMVQKINKSFNLNFGFNVVEKEEIRIYVPKETLLKKLNISTASGKVYLEKIRCEKAILNLVSGNLTATGVQSQGLDIKMISGNANIQGTLTGSNKVDMISGNLNLDIDGAVEDYSRNISKISGSLYIQGEKSNDIQFVSSSKNSFNIQMTSGNIKFNFTE